MNFKQSISRLTSSFSLEVLQIGIHFLDHICAVHPLPQATLSIPVSILYPSLPHKPYHCLELYIPTKNYVTITDKA